MAWNLKGPVRLGDTIHVEQSVHELRPSRSKSDGGVDVRVVSQHQETVHDGEWVVMFRRR
jgi:acyl dehydratase